MANLPVALPPGKTVRNIGGTNFLVPKRRGRRFKLPAKTRKKIAASARRMKIPIITTAALAVGVGDALQKGGGLQNSLTTQVGAKAFGRRLLQNYTGIDTEGKFDFKFMFKGTLPLVVATIARRSGVFKGANQALARTRLPLRLS